MDSESDAAGVTGPLLRRARVASHLSLTDVSQQIGMSVTHLSRLEAGKRQPSIGVLMKLAHIYGTGVGQLLGESTATLHHLTSRDERAVRPGPDGPFTVLTGAPNMRGLHVVELTLDHEGGDQHVSTHNDEEVMFVVSGALELTLGSEQFELGSGDSIHFDARVEHSLREQAPDTRVLIVCAPSQAASFTAHTTKRASSL